MSANKTTAAAVEPWHLDYAMRAARVDESEWRYIAVRGR
jgi:hypothetical protein